MAKNRQKTNQKPKNSNSDNIETKKLEQASKKPKMSNMMLRIISGFSMVALFFLCFFLGHAYIGLLVVAISTFAFREIWDIKMNQKLKNELGASRLIFVYFNIVFFSNSLVWNLGDPIKNSLTENYKFLSIFVDKAYFLGYLFWILGLLMFILSLKKGEYMKQFNMFAWTHVFGFIVTFQVGFWFANIYNGLIWVLMPGTLIVINDVFAYVFGKSFGRTKLIELSPKKTWEGFIGGAFSTIVVGLLIGHVLSYSNSFDYLICPMEKVDFTPFLGLDCEPSSIFNKRYMDISFISKYFGKFYFSEFQLHTIVFSLFASLVAPFGGFFASGLKRALHLKDFSDTIPGHGGILDRFDCLILMGLFTFLYYNQIIRGGYNSIGSVTSYMMNHVSLDDQYKLYKVLENNLISNGFPLTQGN